LPSSFVETSIKLRENELLAPLFFSWKSKTKIYIYHLLKGERVAQSIFQPGENLSPVNERAIVATVIHLSSIIMRFRPESRINPSKPDRGERGPIAKFTIDQWAFAGAAKCGQ